MGFRPRWSVLAVFLTLNAHLASGCGEGSPRPPPGPGDSGPVDRGPDEPSFEGTCTISLPNGQAGALDFGNTQLTSTLVEAIVIRNSSPLPWDVRLGDIEPSFPNAFSLSSPLQAEPFTVPAGGSVEVGITFTPLASRHYQANLPIEAPTWCDLTKIELVGTGVERILLFDQQVDFSYVEPGNTATRELSFQNIGTHHVTFFFEALSLTAPISSQLAGYSPFSIKAINGVTLGAGETGFNQSHVLPPDGSIVTFILAFRPGDNPNHAPGDPDYLAIKGPHAALLRLETDDEKFAFAEISLTGIGGGPKLETIPASELDFKAVAVGSYYTKSITLTNAGTNEPDTTLENLHFRHCRAEDCATALETPPEIRRADGTPSPDFKILYWPPADSGYRDTVGLEAQSSLQLEVMFKPVTQGENLGQREAELHIYTNDPDRADYTLKLVGEAIESPACQLEMSPSKVEFGVVEPWGTSPSFTIVLKNRVATPCIIYALRLEENTKAQGVFMLPLGAKENLYIEGGGTHVVPVRFLPHDYRPYAGVVSLKLNQPSVPETSLLLAGVGGKPCLVFEPYSINFGSMRIGCSPQERSVSLYNQCAYRQVAIQSASLIDSRNGSFRLVTSPPLESLLGHAQETTFSLAYEPAGIGVEATSVELLVSEDYQEPVLLYLPISGTGTIETRQSDIVQQDALPKVDLLFVIDNSSFEEAQMKVATQFGLLAAQASQHGVDYHIAAVSTDPGSGNAGSSGVIEGAFWPMSGKPSQRIVKRSMPVDEQTRLFANMIQMGITGSGTEWLIDPAVQALSSEMTREGAHNAGFLRGDATLHIVTISNARDQGPHELVLYQLFFHRLKGKGRFFYHGIIPVFSPGKCSYDGGTASAEDPRVKTMIADTGGYLGDICTSDWTATLRELYRAIFKSRDTFELSSPPDLGNNIVVKIDGVEFSQWQDGEPIWRFDSSRGNYGAVVFEGTRVPLPGAIVEIDYETACRAK